MRDSFFQKPPIDIIKDIVQIITSILTVVNDFLKLPILDLFISILSKIFGEDINDNKTDNKRTNTI